MVFQVPHYWDVAVDGIQILLCLLILVFLLHNRRRHKSSTLEQVIRKSGKSFNVQVLIQAIKQQIDQAFANIADTMAAERRNLESLLLFNREGYESLRISGSPSPLQPSNPHEISSVSDGMSQIDELHQRVQQLAAKGMSAKQISQELKTPLGEVELILSLNNNAAT